MFTAAYIKFDKNNKIVWLYKDVAKIKVLPTGTS